VTDPNGLSGKEIEPAFGQNMPAPHTLVGLLRERLHALVGDLRAERGEVRAPEDTYVLVRRLAALEEGLRDYAQAFRTIAGEVKGFVQDDLEEVMGEQDGVPNSGMRVPDPEGDIKVDLDILNEYDFDVQALINAIAAHALEDHPAAQAITSDPSAAEHFPELLVTLLGDVMTKLLECGTFKPQVTKVRKLTDAISHTDPTRASTVTSTIKKRPKFRGVKINREVQR
jgi:hypothetical protein